MVSQLLRAASKRTVLGQFGIVGLLEEQPFDCLRGVKSIGSNPCGSSLRSLIPIILRRLTWGVTARRQHLGSDKIYSGIIPSSLGLCLWGYRSKSKLSPNSGSSGTLPGANATHAASVVYIHLCDQNCPPIKTICNKYWISVYLKLHQDNLICFQSPQNLAIVEPLLQTDY